MAINFDDQSTGISYQQYPKDPFAREAISIVDDKVEQLKDKIVSKQEVINLENKVKQSGLDNDNKIAGLKQNIDDVEAKVDGLDGGNLEKIEELETAVNLKADKNVVDSLLNQIEGSVKQINGVEPDEQGNVIIDINTQGLATSEEVTQKTDAIANLVFTKAETSAVEIIADDVNELTTQVGLKATKEEFTTKTNELTSQLADIAYIVHATGNNDTLLINNAINEVSTSKRLKKVILDGEFKVSASGAFLPAIKMKSNVVLEFTPGSKLTLLSNSYDGYYVILCDEINNFEIINPYIVGDRDSHIGTTGEYGHGIGIRGCTAFRMYNVYTEKCWGDGVCIVKSSNIITEDCYINSIKAYKCRRNGVTISSGRNLTIDYIEGNEIDGTLPMAALDIEANTTGEVWENIKLGEVKSHMCPNGIMIDPRTFATYASVSNISLSISSISITGTTPANTGRLTINTADHTKIKGRVNIGKLYVSKNLRGLYLSNFRKGGLVVNIDTADLVTDATGHSGALSTSCAIFASVESAYRTTNNLGSIYIDKLKVTGNAAYSISLQPQNGGTFEKSEFVIGRFVNPLSIPMYIEGRVHNMIKDATPMEVNVADKAAIYKTDTDWYNAHFVSTLYHNEGQTVDIVLRPLSFYGVIGTPITIEIRAAKLIIMNLTGVTITPSTVAFTNGFKSSVIGSKITYKYNDDGTITILSIIGTWASYT